MTKKAICLFSIILLSACFMMFGKVFASSSGAQIIYEISDGSARITSVETNGVSKIVIPSEVMINGVNYSVTEIGERSFYGNTDVVSVSVPDTVKKIGNRAFAGCNNLAEINIPEGVTELKQYTFSDCHRLTSLTLPKSLKKMAYGVIKNCVRLQRVIIKSDTLTITDESDSETFSSIIADYGSSDDIPEVRTNSKSAIGSRVYGATRFFVRNSEVAKQFTERSVPSSAVFVGEQYNVSSLEYGGLSYEIVTEPGRNYAVVKGFAKGCEPNISMTLDIPQSIIAEGVTYTVTEIADKAFYSKGSFEYSNHITAINIPKTVEKIGECAFFNSAVKKLVIPSSVRVVGREAFKGCTQLTELEIEDGVKALDSQSFYRSAIRYMLIPESVKYLNLSSVQSNSYLTQIVIASSEIEFAENLSGLPSDLKFYVSSDAVKASLVQKNVQSGAVTVLSDKIAVLKKGYNYNTLQVMGAKSAILLPKLERALFTHTGWTDGVNTYAPSEQISVTDKLTVLTAQWQFDSDDTTKVNADIVAENASNQDYINRIMKKDETSYVDSNEILNVNINEERIIKYVDSSIFGVTTCGSINADMLIDNTDGSLSEYSDEVIGKLPKFKSVRGDIEPFEGLFDDYSIYTESDTKDDALRKLKMGVNAIIGVYLKINPECEFIFILPVYSEENGVHMSPQACVNMHRFLTDDETASNWGALRQSLGFNKIKIAAYELGNETYYNCRGLSESAENLEVIESESTAYISEAVEYYNQISPYAEGIEFSASLVSADSGFWQDEWNRRVIRGLNEYTNGLYSLHTYYGKYNSPQIMVNGNVDRITAIYRDEIGFFPDIRFAHTEHAMWGSSENRISLMAGLSEMTFLNNIIKRSDTWCADYHTFTSATEKMWGIVNDAEGSLIETAISKAYRMYMENIGDRVADITYNTFVSGENTYDIIETSEAPNSKISVLATASGSDTLVLHIVNSYVEKSSSSVTLNFNFLNSYSLVSEQIYGGYNPYSSILNSETENAVWIKNIEDNLTDNFTSYTIAPNTAAVLVLKTKSAIKSEISEPEKAREIKDGIYADVTKLLSENENGEYEFLVPQKIDCISYSGSGNSFVLKGLNLFGTWETIASCSTVGASLTINDYTDSYFTKIKLINADKSEVRLFSRLSENNENYIVSDNGYINFISLENGVINDCSDIYCSDGGITDVGGGNFKINLYGKSVFTADVASVPTDFKLHITDVTGGKNESDDFNGLTTGLLNGADKIFADKRWKSSSHNNAFKFGINEYDSSDVNAEMMDNEYLVLSSRAASNNPSDYAAVYYNDETDLNGAGITFNSARCVADIEYGVRFLVHNDGKNFYQLGIQKYSALSTDRQWVLSKVTDGVKQELVCGVYSVNPAGASNRITLVFDKNGIYWTGADASSGRIINSLCGSYKPEGGIELCKSTYGFYAYSDSTEKSDDKYVYIDNVKAVMFGIDGWNFDYSISDGVITVNGLDSSEGFVSKELTIPSEINGIPVKKIAPSAFENAEITRLVISEEIEEIGERAFFGSKIVSADIPGTITSWGKASFQDCEYLRTINLGEGIKKIPDAFYNCNCLNYFIIPQSVEEIDCTALALPRLRLVIFEGNTVKLVNTGAITQNSKLGSSLAGDVIFYYINDSMGTALTQFFDDDILLRISDGTEQYAVFKKLDRPAVTAYFQRGNADTGGTYHYKTMFVYANKSVDGQLLFADYGTNGGLMGCFKQSVRLGSGQYGVFDVTDCDISAGEKKNSIAIIFINSFNRLSPLSRAFKSTPW